ncbi:MBL fold metallo-hydrolase [Virgifigura deserti]|uniref:MBL fold metallo-hydrolase n=1 Tax=Virgifigura deserti TaxID=2268457 RepID=UPI003CCC1FBB
MMGRTFAVFVAALTVWFAVPAVSIGWAQTVKITPLGSHDGEFCRSDRAFLLEDSDGTTLLFDVGRTVAGPEDPRLGEVDVVLLSGVHGDHIGDQRIAEVNAGSCAEPATTVATTPASNTALISAGKGATIIVGGHMHEFLAAKLEQAGGSADQVQILRFGGKRTVNGVQIAIIPVVHANGVSPDFLNTEITAALEPDGLTAYVGPDNGYVVSFSNGLVVYLSGDTGHTSDMETIVQRYYQAELAIMNMGDIYTMGPEEAAWAVEELIKPKAVIPSHANEAATEGGAVVPGTRTQRFVELVENIPVHLPLSGRTMEFDGDGSCVKGC